MTVSDILTLFGILVSVFFGYLVTHYHSVRDVRTRVLKDHYIEQIKGIKGRVDQFFHRLAFGKSSCKKVVKWYDHISIDIKSIDDGVRKSLDLQIDRFDEILDLYYGKITSWDDYNDKYSNANYLPNNECRAALLVAIQEIDDFLNEYISHINQANNYPIWKTQKRRIDTSKKYYSKLGLTNPKRKAIWERIEKHIWELSFSLIAIVAMVVLCCYYKPVKEVDIEGPLRDISVKQDSIFHTIKQLEEKYQPTQIHSQSLKST